MKKSKRATWMGLALVLLMTAAGCGDDGDSKESSGSSGGGEAAASASDGATPSPEDVRACLEEGGFDLDQESNLNADLQRQLGIEEQLVVAGNDELTGLGSVTWYVDEDTAKDAYESGGAVLTEEVARGIKGRLDYHYSGTDEAVQVLEGCI
jgi:hypothetical protein